MIWITRILLLLLLLLSSITFSSIIKSKKAKSKTLLGPKRSLQKQEAYFSLTKKDYENLGEGILGTKNYRVKKDLEQNLILLGVNSRPDCSPVSFFCSYRGKALKFNEKTRYKLDEISDNYLEEASNFHFEFSSHLSGAQIEIRENLNSSFSFELKSQPALKSAQIDDFKLDSYLLVRQKASWCGRDLFLEKYGGDEFSKYRNSERLDFMHSKIGYSLFAEEKSLFVWKDGQWRAAEEEETEKYPLMRVEKISPKIMEIAVWDITGFQKEKMLLTKTQSPQVLKKETPLKYIGAKSSHKWLFKTDKERMTIEEGDWLILSNGRWSKISNASEIDHYVSNIGVGELFIVKALSDQNGKKKLIGDLFNPMRTEMTHLILDVSKTSKSK